MNQAEKILINERFDDCINEVAKILDTINNQVIDNKKISYSSLELGNVNNKFKETIKKL